MSKMSGGWILTLGVLASAALGQEGAWRPAGSRSPDAAAATVPARTSNLGFSLGKPIPLTTPLATSGQEESIAPASFRPSDPIVRLKTDPPRPLPSGPLPVLPQETIKPIPLEQAPAPKEMPRKHEPSEAIPFSPRPVISSTDDFTSSYGPCCGGPILDCCACCDSCFPCCDECGDCCERRPRLWMSAEYLAWGFSGQRIPVLVTTSADNTPASIAGIFGQDPTIRNVYDEDIMRNSAHHGGRFGLGFWFRRDSDLGLEASYFFLSREGEQFTAASGANGLPILTRPFVDVTPGSAGNNANIVSHPNVNTVPGAAPFAQSGSVVIDQRSSLWGFDVNLRHKLACGPRWWLDALYGYRQIELNDSITIVDTENVPTALGGTQIVTDSFSSINQFTGGQIGLSGEVRLLRRWFVNGSGKVAFGNTHSILKINGSTTFAINNNTVQGGLLALQSNIGTYRRDEFTVSPEFGLKFGMDINDNWRFWVGYNVLWLPNAIRAGEQIDPTINRNLIPLNITTKPNPPGPTGPASPSVPFRIQDFWAQGFSVGLERRW